MIQNPEFEEELRDDPTLWLDYAACIGTYETDERLIFPWGHNPPEPEEVTEWIENHCMECPVRQNCLDFGLKTESEGVWGGVELTPSRVLRLRRLRLEQGSVTVEQASKIFDRS